MMISFSTTLGELGCVAPAGNISDPLTAAGQELFDFKPVVAELLFLVEMGSIG
jgi:hypothetical protein